MNHFLEIMSGGLGWLSSVPGILANVAAVALSGLLIVLMTDQKSYDAITGWMGEQRRVLYRRWLNLADAGLRRFFGARLLNWRAFDRCLLLAFFYPIFLLLLAWIFGAEPRLGGVVLFKPEILWWQKILGVAGLLPALCLFWWLIFWREGIVFGLLRFLPERIGQHPKVVFITKILVLTPAYFGTIALALLFTGSVAAAVPLAGAAALLTGAGTAILVLTLAGPFAYAAAGVGGVSISILVFYGLLPIANAVMDWLSWAVSRRLLGDLVERGAEAGGAAIIVHAIVDLVAAVVLLAGLAMLLPFVLQAVSLVLDETNQAPVEWWDYLAAARRAPLGEGLFVTGMLFSTLLPTAAHFLMMMFALLLPHPVWLREPWEDWLTDPDPSVLQKLGVLGVFAVSATLSWGLLFLFGITLYAALSAFGTDFGTWLAELALWSGGLLGPPLPPGAGMP